MRTSSRYVEVSHWGNIFFKEHYDMQNRAAEFKGEFSTIDFNDNRKDTGKNAFRRGVVTFPASVWGLEYRDELGNITTSRAYRRESEDRAYAVLTPRFALQGGWNHTWEISYNVPAEDVLTQNIEGTEFEFLYPLSQLVVDGNSELFTIRVALPEGAVIDSVR